MPSTLPMIFGALVVFAAFVGPRDGPDEGASVVSRPRVGVRDVSLGLFLVGLVALALASWHFSRFVYLLGACAVAVGARADLSQWQVACQGNRGVDL